MLSVKIIENGKTNWRIVCLSQSESGIGFAAEELREYVKQISGCELPICIPHEEDEEPKHFVVTDAQTQPTIILALRRDLAPANEALLPPAAMGHDGYALAVIAKNVVVMPNGRTMTIAPHIIVAGDNTRGVIYGVYDLLEQMGCRWFYPAFDANDPEVVPRASTISLAETKKAVASPLAYRIYNGSEWFFEIDPARAIGQIDHAMKCRYNGMGWQCTQTLPPLMDQYNGLKQAGVMDEVNKRGMFIHGPAHAFDQFLPNNLFEEHPEWFGFRNGARRRQAFLGSQYCWSNPEARKVMIDNAEKFVLAAPEIKILYSMGLDGVKCCECPECLKSSPADLVVLLMNELCERLKMSAPHVIVETSGGYPPVHDPPSGSVAPSPDLRLMWDHWGRSHDWGNGYDDATYGRKGNLEAWRAFINDRVTMCQFYADNFASPWIAAPYVACMESDRRYLLTTKIDGWYTLIWPRGYWWNHSFNIYLAGVAFYDVTVDLWEAVRDYARRYFGPKAGPLMAAYYEQWAREPRLSYRTRDFAEDYDRAVLTMQRKAWINPAVRAARKDPVYSHRVAKAERIHTFAEKAAEMWRLREEIRGLRSAGKLKKASEKLEAARKYTEDFIVWLNELADLEQGLVDRNEIPGFLGMKIRNWVVEETKALEAGIQARQKDEIKEMNAMEVLPAEVTKQL